MPAGEKTPDELNHANGTFAVAGLVGNRPLKCAWPATDVRHAGRMTSTVRALVLFAMLVVRAASPSSAADSTNAPTKPAPAGDWQPLFDGKTLAGWAQSEFEMGGAVKVQAPFRDGAGAIVIEKGTTLSGITWTRGAVLPKTNYEISLEVMRLAGDDFFCGLTFPVGKESCSFIVGGWGGAIVGISNVDYSDASDNETTHAMYFDDNRWYRIRVRVTPRKLEAWIDNEQMVDLELKGHGLTLRPGDIQKSLPLGIATYMTTAAVRDIRLKRLSDVPLVP